MINKLEILIVEDDAVFRQTVKKLLLSKFKDISISIAANGQEAFEKLKSNCRNLIIMDIELPGESGLVLTKKIKATHPHTVIIILTNHDLQEYREAAFRNGADYFLSKETSKTNEIFSLIDSIINPATTVIHH